MFPRETGSFLSGGLFKCLLCQGITHPQAPVAPTFPSPAGEGHETDLDFLLVVVDLPGDVNMHGTPLPWFLERERAMRSEGRPCRENHLQLLQSFSAALGCKGTFTRNKSAQCPPAPVSLGPREPQLAATASQTLLDGDFPSYQGQDGKSPSPTLCLFFLFWCQLADLGECEALLNECGHATMQIGCSEELISECLGIGSKQERPQKNPCSLPPTLFCPNPQSGTKKFTFFLEPSSHKCFAKSQRPFVLVGAVRSQAEKGQRRALIPAYALGPPVSLVIRSRLALRAQE